MSVDMLLASAIVGAPFGGAAVVAILRTRRARSAPAFLALTTGTISSLLTAGFWAAISRPLYWRTDWIASSNIGVGLYVDDLSLLFAILVVGVSLLSLLHSLRDIPHYVSEHRLSSGEAAYYGYMLLFTGSMLGMVFAADLVQLYVFWELTGIASFLLIGLDWHDPQARHGAVKALLITALGGLAMLVGFILIGVIAGTFALPAVLQAGDSLRASPAFSIALLLLVVGAATKSAQFPFHVWLPSAMIAPTPVSAFLHSAALVAAGVYLLARFHLIFAIHPLWQWLIVGIGLASMLVGGILALKARQFKAILAYSTISQYGFVFTLLGYASGEALAAALFSFFQHGLIKSALFFAAGAITYATGRTGFGSADRRWRAWRALPVLFIFSAILAFSLGGLPPLAGFWMKEGFLAATIETQSQALLALGLVASALTLSYMLRFLIGAFSDGAPRQMRIERPPVTMLVAPGAMALLTVMFGLWPDIAAAALIEPATRAVLGEAIHLDLALHFDPKLLLSLLALALGGLALATYRQWAFLIEMVTQPEWSLDHLYAKLSSWLSLMGQHALRLQNGFLRSYLYLTLLGLFGLLVFSGRSLLVAPTLPSFAGGIPAHRGLIDWAMALLLLLVVVGTVFTFTVQRHSHMILALSAVGYLIAGVFALELAPDVGLVQVHVETLVTVLFILALVLIPRSIRQRFSLPPRERLTSWMMALAILGGLGSAWLSWLAIEHTAADPIAPWFNENAIPLVHAGDAVAAILIDFRALDTLGEITVFATAAAGVYALLRLIRREVE